MPKFSFDGQTVSIPTAAQRQFGELTDTFGKAALVDARFASLAKAMKDAVPLVGVPEAKPVKAKAGPSKDAK